MKRYHDESMVRRMEERCRSARALAYFGTLIMLICFLVGIWAVDERATNTGILFMFLNIPLWFMFASAHDNLEGVRR